MLAVQLDGIHTDVHEQIQPVFGAHAVGVTGGKRHSNLTVGGRQQLTFGGFHGGSIAERTGCEGRILHLG